jgi:hypothetical protein
MVLAMQQMGCAQAAGAVLGGMLSVGHNSFKNSWPKLEEKIGAMQVILGNTILEENLRKEKELSPVDENGYCKICASIDAGWNNKGSGKSYHSDSCHHITVGNRTNLVIALHYMSKRCSKCESRKKNKEKNSTEIPLRKNTENSMDDTNKVEETNPVKVATINNTPGDTCDDPALCPRNYDGSSKGMESHGALYSCVNLHENHNVIYEIIVMDDDSSTENILKWNFADALEAELISEIPLTAGGNKKTDKGQLPLTHPPIKRLADINHRNRCMAGKVYNLARLPKKKSMCSTADAERLKRNMNSALHEFKSHDFPTFKRMIWAVLNHHFNIHDTCGDWCRSRRHAGNAKELAKLHYRCKDKNAELYTQLLAIWEVYCTDECLKEVHHKWHTNKCESMHQFITKFVRKCYHLCRSIVGKARMYLAVGLDSVGYEEYYRSILYLLEFEYDEITTFSHHQLLDKN